MRGGRASGPPKQWLSILPVAIAIRQRSLDGCVVWGWGVAWANQPPHVVHHAACCLLVVMVMTMVVVVMVGEEEEEGEGGAIFDEWLV